MWGLVIELGIFLGIYIYHRLTEDHPGSTVNTFTTPRVDEGAPIPLIYGQCRVRTPILAWAGSQRNLPIGRAPNHIDDAPGYFLDMLYVLGIPFYGGGAELLRIYVGDRAVTPTLSSEAAPTYTGDQSGSIAHLFDTAVPGIPIHGPAQSGRTNYWAINQLGSLFPVDILLIAEEVFEPVAHFGFVEFFDGSPAQQISDGIDDADQEAFSDTQAVLEARPLNGIYSYLTDDLDSRVDPPPLDENILPSDIPSYRNLMTACLYRWCNGDTASLPTYSFEVSSRSDLFSSDWLNVTKHDADPAAVIYDLLTSPWAKLGIPTEKIDLPSFQAASLTLLAEDHGYSRAIEQVEDAEALVNDVLRQVDGMVYEEPTTGKIVLKLVRNDYDVDELDDINPGNMQATGAGWYQVQGWSETLNQVRVTYTNRAQQYADDTAVAQNAANATGQGKLRSTDIRYVGCCTGELAQKLASRELAFVSRPNVKATCIVDRSFHATRPGDVVTLTWPELDIDHMVMRVAKIDHGQLHAGQITLDLIRDVFDVSLGAFPVAV